MTGNDMRLGIFGGTFDPIHNLHLFVAESARLTEGYRAKPEAAPEHRCAMILGAIDSNPYFALDDTDLRADASGYTADLLPKLKTRYPGSALTFITGADSLASSSWVRFEEVLESLESFVIAPRAGVSTEAVSRVLAAIPISLRSRVKTLNLPEMPESATLVRTLLAQGKSVRYLVPEAVWQYIAAQNLYGVEAAV